MKEFVNKILQGDCLETVKSLPDKSINSVITSPPYFHLRDYGYKEQWGLEASYHDYLDNLIALMAELKRVLKDDGTIWINLGDSYAGSCGMGSQYDRKHKEGMKVIKQFEKGRSLNIPNKSQMLIPHRFAIRCIDELDLIVRNDIIWAKRNGMPESVTDRFSKKHEYFFLMVKQQKYYFDLDSVREEQKVDSIKRYLRGNSEQNKNAFTNGGPGNSANTMNKPREYKGYGKLNEEIEKRKGKNPGDVSDFWDGYEKPTLEKYLELCKEYYLSEGDFWDVPTKPSKAKHYATFNTDLVDKPIKAGCPKDGIILDPFCGTGTTLIRAMQLGRNVIGIDGSKEYCEIAEERLKEEQSQIKLAI